jgi:signal transduction histidine kinase/ligand-binding sensor domain-containing protein/DNA-binding response OmpR family regulator
MRSLLICLFSILSAALTAQTETYRFSHITSEGGLSHNQIKCFFKDSFGFMWFGTRSGLNRFDGHSISVFRNDPRDSSSITNDDVNKIFEDPDGNLWISSWTGLDIYDPLSERFHRRGSGIVAKYGLPDGNLSDIVKDNHGNYWFVHVSKGLYCYNVSQKKTYHLNYVDPNIYTLSSNDVASLQPGQDSDVWIIHKNGIIERIDPGTLKIESRDSSIYHLNSGAYLDYRIMPDHDGDLWVYITDSNRGMYYLKPSTGKISHFTNSSSPMRLGSEIVRGVVQDNEGLIWIGTDHGGLNIIDKKKQTINYILHSNQDPHSLSQNSINALYKDNEGIIWAGTFKSGVSYFHENNVRFPLFQFDEKEQSTSANDVNAFAEDKNGNLWIGTNGGGLLFLDRKTGKYRQHLHDPRDANSISSNIIVSLCYDRQDKLWIGTYFGGLNCYDGNRFIHYKNVPGDDSSISDNSIWEIFEDSEGNLFIGTLTKGVDVFDAQRKKIAHYSPSVQGTIHGNYVPAFTEDKEGKIWIGTGYGVEVFDRSTKKFRHYLSQAGNPSSLSHNSVLSIIEDSRGYMWIGTHGGLNMLDRKTGKFRVFTTTHGLPHNTILTMAEDDGKNLWIGTPNGLANMKLQFNGDSLQHSIFKYDQFDGLQGRQFNENAILKTRKGELVFGGANGFNIFDPADVPVNKIVPPVVITRLEILNQSIRTGRKFDDRTILTQSITHTEKLELKHKDNVFSLEFAVLSFNHPERSQYRYLLEGFDTKWNTTTADRRRVTYTNLDPGDYIFKVQASNNDGVWNGEGAMLKITVLPPWWRTRSAMVLYSLLILGALYITRRLVQRRERMKFAIEEERREAQRMHELDMMKIKFFTNVSHEFRTPLTLILTPIERMLKRPGETMAPAQFELIYRNAKRLLNLVNQLLDFRKLEVQDVKFNASEGDIIKFVKETVFSFSDLSDKKGIALHFDANVEGLDTVFDQDKLEKILFNLLSNAFKFTPEGGEVNVKVDFTSQRSIHIKVCDTGIGIPEDKKEKIFERFFQSDVPNTMLNQGSGIGLSITREFVRAHDGTITVESTLGRGSCFTVVLPYKELSERRAKENVIDAVDAGVETAPVEHHKGGLSSILIIEDNEDFRFYLKDNLRLHYEVFEAADGKEGWAKIIGILPDLIVMDVMMPQMNGLDLCRKVKGDSRVSHTPVILLTARTSEEQKMEGFDSGADDYITKPFNFEILQSRIRNLIHQRELLHKEMKQKVDVKASSLQITSLDEKLLKKALEVVENRLSDSEFSVEELSRELGMSRVHLYKKLQALTGKSPIEFIRNIRLQHAAQFLEKSQLTVSEVAYKVGFNNPKYFARYFKEEYKVLPSQYASARRKDA